MSNKILSWVTILTVLCIIGSETSSLITKCKQDDGQCYKNNAENLRNKFADGWPEYNVETLDPLSIKEIDASATNLKIKLNDAIITGLRNCDIKKLVRNPSKETLIVSILCDIKLESNYNMKGKLSLFPIEGEGKLHVQVDKILINGEAKMPEEVGKDGKRHWKITSWTEEFEILGNSYVHFGNLFNGNKDLSSAVDNFIAGNGKLVITELGNPIVNAIISKLAKAVTYFLRKLSIEDLAL